MHEAARARVYLEAPTTENPTNPPAGRRNRCALPRWRSRLDERGLHLALVAGVALEAVAEARVVVALAAAAALVVVVVRRGCLGDVREVVAERLHVDARELGRAAVEALRGVDDDPC